MSLPLLMVLLVVAPAVLSACGRESVKAPEEKSAVAKSGNPYADLRAMALDGASHDLPSVSEGHPDVVGVVIDIPSSGGYATVVALADGATSMYTSVGGGVIGAGEHERVASANSELLREAQKQLAELDRDESVDHPSTGFVRMFVLTEDGRRVVDVPEKQFWAPDSGRLGPLIAAAQAVITEVRQAPSK